MFCQQVINRHALIGNSQAKNQLSRKQFTAFDTRVCSRQKKRGTPRKSQCPSAAFRSNSEQPRVTQFAG